MDRVHRLGQTRAVEVYRYAVEDSIEQRILLLQAQKRQLAAAAFGRRGAEDAREVRPAPRCARSAYITTDWGMRGMMAVVGLIVS